MCERACVGVCAEVHVCLTLLQDLRNVVLLSVLVERQKEKGGERRGERMIIAAGLMQSI